MLSPLDELRNGKISRNSVAKVETIMKLRNTRTTL